MAWKNTAASAAFAASGSETRVQKLIISGSHATTIGTAILKTGGTGGTAQIGPLYVGPGETIQIDIPYVKADFITLSNALAVVEFHMVKGV